MTKQDYIDGQAFWLWAKENLEVRDKESWPEYERIERLCCECSFCEEHEPTATCDFEKNFTIPKCPTCPLQIKYGLSCFEDGSPYAIWATAESNDKERLKAIQQIIDVYQEEIDKRE